MMEDWYKVTAKIITENGGHRILKGTGNSPLTGSPSSLLRSLYTEYPWMLCRFNNVSHGFWASFTATENLDEIRNLLEWLAQQLQLRSLDDWYRVSGIQIQRFIPIAGFSTTILPKLLQRAYPDQNWDISKLTMKGSLIRASQRQLVTTINKIFFT